MKNAMWLLQYSKALKKNLIATAPIAHCHSHNALNALAQCPFAHPTVVAHCLCMTTAAIQTLQSGHWTAVSHSGQLHFAAASACAMRRIKLQKLVKVYSRPIVEYKIVKESRTNSEFASL